MTTTEAIHRIVVQLLHLEMSRDDDTVEIVPQKSVEGYKSSHSAEDEEIITLRKIRVIRMESRRQKLMKTNKLSLKGHNYSATRKKKYRRDLDSSETSIGDENSSLVDYSESSDSSVI